MKQKTINLFVSCLIILSISVQLFAASGDITIRARGVLGGEVLSLDINDVEKASWTLTSSYQNFTYTSSDSSANVKTRGSNCAGEYAVYIDYITSDGTTYQGEDQATNTGIWNGSSCGGSYNEQLSCDGYIDFGTISIIGDGTPLGGDDTSVPLSNYIYNDMENMTIGSGDSDCDVYDYQSVRQRVYRQGSGQKVTASSAYKRAGSNSMKFECTASGSQNPDRVELYQENNWQSTYPDLYHDIYNKPHAIGFSVYFPSDFPTPTNWFVFYQVKQHDSNVNPSPNIAWDLDKYGNLDFVTRHGTKSNNNYAVRYTKSMSEYKGKWTDFVCEFKITANSDGYCRLYEKSPASDVYNLVMSYDGMLGYSDCDTTHMEIKGGVYRGQQNLTHTLYQDEIRYGTTKDSVKISESASFSSILSSTKVNEVNKTSGVTLKQSCPNPFSESTEVSYTLTEDAHVQLDVYDFAGRVVNTLVNKNQTANTYTQQWNALDSSGNTVSNGIYFYTLTVNTENSSDVESGKVSFIKLK